MKQTNSFVYRGLKVDRKIISHTQSTYTLTLESENVVIGPFDGEAPYDSQKMVHAANDGRENMWWKTDDEIKAAIDVLINPKSPIYTTERDYAGKLKYIRAAIAKLEEKSELNISSNFTVIGIDKENLYPATVDYLKNFIVYEDKLHPHTDHLYNIADAMDDIDDEQGYFAGEVEGHDKSLVLSEVAKISKLQAEHNAVYVKLHD